MIVHLIWIAASGIRSSLFCSSGSICWGLFVKTSKVDPAVHEVQQPKGMKPWFTFRNEFWLLWYHQLSWKCSKFELLVPKVETKVYIETSIFKCPFSISFASGPSCCSRLQAFCQETQQLKGKHLHFTQQDICSSSNDSPGKYIWQLPPRHNSFKPS